MSAFIIQSISVYNYSANNKKLSGTCEVKHEHTEMKMTIKLDEQDIARIFEIFADRVAVTMGTAARAVYEDVMPQAQLTAPVVPPAVEAHGFNEKSLESDEE